MGFEPTFSTVTRWRALQAAPRGRIAVAQVGVEPTASPGLSRGGLPVAYPAVLTNGPVPETALRELNPPCRFGRPAPAPIGQRHKPAEAERRDLSRLIAPPFSSRLPSPIAFPPSS